MNNEEAIKIFKLDHPTSHLFGESYIVVCAYSPSENTIVAEYYLLTSKNSQAMKRGSLTYVKNEEVPEQITIDIDFLLKESQQQAEVEFHELIHDLVEKTKNENYYTVPIVISEPENNKLIGCWLRGKFHSEIKEIHSVTKCKKMLRIFGAITGMKPFKMS